jgi:hypothetical protein
LIVQVKALACELSANLNLPLSRLSATEIAREAVKQGLVAQISGTTVWRWLSADAIRPWQHRCEPYRSARRVFWIADGGSSHRGESAAKRLHDWYRNAVLVHTPVHASWLNQIEIYFSIVQRKALMPNDFEDLNAVERRLLGFQRHYEKIATPFEWKFTRDDLNKLLAQLKKKS